MVNQIITYYNVSMIIQWIGIDGKQFYRIVNTLSSFLNLTALFFPVNRNYFDHPVKALLLKLFILLFVCFQLAAACWEASCYLSIFELSNMSLKNYCCVFVFVFVFSPVSLIIHAPIVKQMQELGILIFSRIYLDFFYGSFCASQYQCVNTLHCQN